MRFDKCATTIEEQLKLLQDRGMNIASETHACACLKTIGYYRLSAYWLPFERPPEDGRARSKVFIPDTKFDDVYSLYLMDRALRLRLMEAIDRIETNVRSRWTNRMALEYGSHAHLDHNLFMSASEHSRLLHRLATSVDKSEETFIKHYKRKYCEPYSPPLWAATELMSIGDLSKWISNTKDTGLRGKLAKDIGFPTRETFKGSFQALAYVRNICAHHGRLWNRRFVKRIPIIRNLKSDQILEEHKGQLQPANLLYNYLVIILFVIRHQQTGSEYLDRLKDTLEAASPRLLSHMGFPENWQNRPAWNPPQ